MEKQRFIFDLDRTLLKADYSQEKNYFKSVLNYEDSKKFIPMIGKLLSEYEKNHERYDVLMLSKYLTEKTEINISTKITNGWKQSLGETDAMIIEGGNWNPWRFKKKK